MPYREGLTNLGPATVSHIRANVFGRVFFVGDSDTTLGISAADIGVGTLGSDSYGLDPYFPFATLEYCITNACVAGRGDVIYVVPGTTIDLTAAAGLDLDIAGITIIGLGNNDNRPSITCSGTDDNTDMDIDAAGITIENFLFDMTGNDSVAAFIDVNAADFTLRKCRILLADSGGQVDIGIDVGTGAHRCLIEDCEFFGDTADSVAVTVAAVVTEFTMRRCKVDMVGATGVGCVEFTAAATNVLFEDCFFANRVGSATATVDCNANAVTGAMVRCNHVLGTIAAAGSGILPVVSTGQAAYIASIENYVVNDQDSGGAGEAGALVGTAST